MGFKINLIDQRPGGASLPLATPVMLSGSYTPVCILITSGGSFPLSSVLQKLWTGLDGIEIAQSKTGGLTDYRPIQVELISDGAGNYTAFAFAQDFNQNPQSGNADANYLPAED